MQVLETPITVRFLKLTRMKKALHTALHTKLWWSQLVRARERRGATIEADDIGAWSIVDGALARQ